MVSDKLKRMVGKADQPIAPLQESRLPLHQISDRSGGDTRPLNQAHIEALAESIAAVGLIQPIAIDSQGRLLAGGHRRAAIAHLQETNPNAFFEWFERGIPVHRFDFDASQDEGRALAIEVSENERRRDYSAVEVRALADRLVEAGYTNQRGGVKKGTKAIGPSLEVITGKSRRTIERYLSKPSKPELNPTGDGFTRRSAPIARSLIKLIGCDDCPDDVKKAAEKLIKLLGK
jgi:ParB family transcriptional regulator, chromosome partitioning protein